VLPRIRFEKLELVEWLEIFGAQHEEELKCAYCGRTVELLDHLNPTILEKTASGFFAELGNLVPACRPCNESRGKSPWETWLKEAHANQGDEILQSRIAVLKRFEQWRTAEQLEPRQSGDQQMWAEYDQIQKEIKGLLARAKVIADQLRADVTADYEKHRKKSGSFPTEAP
jgi:hypothetical protein